MRRRWFLITRALVKRREAILIEQEDAAIRAARDDAKTDKERALADSVLRQRAAKRVDNEG